MSPSPRPTVNLLCLDASILPATPGDGDNAGRSLALALTHCGWQVNLFTAADLVASPGPAPSVPIVPVAATRSPAEVAQVIETSQRRQGLVWPLLHTLGPQAAPVGALVKATQGWCWLHTPAGAGDADALTANQKVFLVPPAGTVLPLVKPEPHSLPLPPPRLNQSPGDIDWDAIAHHLAPLYRYHLAIHVGAADLVLPGEVAIPVSMQRSDSARTLHLVA